MYNPSITFGALFGILSVMYYLDFMQKQVMKSAVFSLLCLAVGVATMFLKSWIPGLSMLLLYFLVSPEIERKNVISNFVRTTFGATVILGRLGILIGAIILSFPLSNHLVTEILQYMPHLDSAFGLIKFISWFVITSAMHFSIQFAFSFIGEAPRSSRPLFY